MKRYKARRSMGEKQIKALMITGQIEGHTASPEGVKSTKYEDMIPNLLGLEEDSNVGGVLLLLNTVGGDVEAGLAIAEAIAGMSKPTVSLILGGGHSIGVPLAVSADYSFITHTASMIVHPVRMNGVVLGAPQAFDYLTKMQNRINSFITNHSTITQEELQKLLFNTTEMSCDIGSILYGQEAVDVGLIDCVGSLSDALRKLKDLMK